MAGKGQRCSKKGTVTKKGQGVTKKGQRRSGRKGTQMKIRKMVEGRGYGLCFDPLKS